MKFNLVIIGMLIVLFSLTFVLADSDHEADHEAIFEEAKDLIDSQITCEELSDSQLEILGEYYMELMHPGELHIIMDNRMGGEGSESLRLAHINIGNMQYCGEYGGMGGVGFMMGGGMMGGGMMGSYSGGDSYSSVYKNSVNNYGVFGWIVKLLVVAVLVLLIVLLYKKSRKKK